MMLQTARFRADPAYAAALQEAGLGHAEAVLSRIEGRIAAWSRTTDVLYVARADGPGFYVKRYFHPRWATRLRGFFRGTFLGMNRAQAEYLALVALRSAGVPAVRPVAFGWARTAHFLRGCFLITEEAPQARNLTSLASDVASGRVRLSPAEQRALISALAGLFAGMHESGAYHGNCFWRNVLVRMGPGGAPEFFLLDPRPPRAWQRWFRAERSAETDLVRLAVSAMAFATRAQGVRFLREYSGVARLTPEVREAIRRIGALAARWRRHEQRRIEMNARFDEWNGQLERETRHAASSPGAATPEALARAAGAM